MINKQLRNHDGNIRAVRLACHAAREKVREELGDPHLGV